MAFYYPDNNKVVLEAGRYGAMETMHAVLARPMEDRAIDAMMFNHVHDLDGPMQKIMSRVIQDGVIAGLNTLVSSSVYSTTAAMFERLLQELPDGEAVLAAASVFPCQATSCIAVGQHTVLLSTDYTSTAEGDMGDRRDRHLRISVGDAQVDRWSRQASSITGFGRDLDGRPDFSCLLRGVYTPPMQPHYTLPIYGMDAVVFARYMIACQVHLLSDLMLEHELTYDGAVEALRQDIRDWHEMEAGHVVSVSGSATLLTEAVSWTLEQAEVVPTLEIGAEYAKAFEAAVRITQPDFALQYPSMLLADGYMMQMEMSYRARLVAAYRARQQQ